MLAEISSTIHFLTDLLRNKGDLPHETVVYFSRFLQDVITEHYQNHWFPEVPLKGSGYRCIRINGIMDPLISRAVQCAGLVKESIHGAFPEELTIWVDPGEVSYRIGENGSIGRIYPPNNTSSMTGNQSCNSYRRSHNNQNSYQNNYQNQNNSKNDFKNKRFYMNYSARDRSSYPQIVENVNEKSGDKFTLRGRDDLNKNCAVQLRQPTRRDSSKSMSGGSTDLTNSSDHSSFSNYDCESSCDSQEANSFFFGKQDTTAMTTTGGGQRDKKDSIQSSNVEDTDYGSYSSSSSFSSIPKSLNLENECTNDDIININNSQDFALFANLPNHNQQQQLSTHLNTNISQVDEVEGEALTPCDNSQPSLTSNIPMLTRPEYYNGIGLCKATSTTNHHNHMGMLHMGGNYNKHTPGLGGNSKRNMMTLQQQQQQPLSGYGLHNNAMLLNQQRAMYAHPPQIHGTTYYHHPAMNYHHHHQNTPIIPPSTCPVCPYRCCGCVIDTCSLSTFVSGASLNKFSPSSTNNYHTPRKSKLSSSSSNSTPVAVTSSASTASFNNTSNNHMMAVQSSTKETTPKPTECKDMTKFHKEPVVQMSVKKRPKNTAKYPVTNTLNTPSNQAARKNGC